jgi:hypothetical protein
MSELSGHAADGAAGRASELDHVIGALVAPRSSFESIARRPTWRLALVILAVLGSAAVWAGYSKVETGEFVSYLEAMGRPLPAGADGAQILRFTRVSSVVGAAIFAPLVYLAVAGIFLGLLQLLGGELDFRRSLSVTAHGFLPFGIAAIGGLATAAMRQEVTMRELEGGALVPSHLGVFAAEGASSLARAALSSVDLFSIWCILLLGIGYSTVARVPRGKAFGAVGVVWAIGVLVKLGLAALRGAA